jgi:scyllo-inositol 2-dehydrogenase (NADP+)
MMRMGHAGPRVRCAVVGYGPVFNWGWMHIRWLRAVPEMEAVAVCDRDPECAARARRDYPELDVYSDLGEMLRRDDIDLVSIVTQHNTHEALARQCLGAGKHVCVEKPMCITVEQADAMLEAARTAGKTLAVFHNRRHDGNMRAIKRLVDDGALGELFHVEATACGLDRSLPSADDPNAWRASKEAAGGGLYDWGAHVADWVLQLVPSRMVEISGFHRTSPHAGATEEHTHAVIRFENGCLAQIIQSRAAYAGTGRLWYILGTKGAIVDSGANAIAGYCTETDGPSGGSLKLYTDEGERDVPYMTSDWSTYYADLAAHLLRGAPAPVTGEDGRRVIALLETTGKSAALGRSLPAPCP